ncbi:MAG TPA: twin-arginine translocase subunit TatC [Candidatus Saccharimonadales bacterium]|nr:twin-arginine translocase subunit TatC [Candidatus Saccharimonadales bacterium]
MDGQETIKEERHLGQMGLLQHLQELRQRVIYSLIAVVVCFLAVWYFADRIFKLIEVPIQNALAAHKMDTHLNYDDPTGPFNLYMKTGLIVGIFAASPILLYQLWMFISPGLYRREKRFVLPFLFLSVGLFLSGGFFGYKIVFPVALDFLIGYATDFHPVIMADKYFSLFLTIILGLAIIFELPIVLGFMGMLGVVNARFLFKHIRGAVFMFFVVAAILTPTTDPLNMTIYAAPLIALYILSIGIVWLVHPRQRKKRRDKKILKP